MKRVALLLLAALLIAALIKMGLLDFFKPQSERYPKPETVEVEDGNLILTQATRENPLAIVGRIADTHSMEPTLMGGDAAVVQKIPYADLKEGDIITYRPEWVKAKYKPGETVHPVIHRIVQKDKGGWIASGDNNSRSESNERVTEQNYEGKLTRVYRVKKAPAK